MAGTPPGAADAAAQMTNTLGGIGGFMMFLELYAQAWGVIISALAVVVAALAHWANGRRQDRNNELERKLNRIDTVIQNAKLNGSPCDCELIKVVEDIID